MESVNEQVLSRIAIVMGWRLTGAGKQARYVDDSTHRCVFYLSDIEDEEKMMVPAKKCQQRMVEDGWRVVVTAYSTKMFEAAAFKRGECCHVSDTLTTEPAAIVELFKKVYGIREVGHE